MKLQINLIPAIAYALVNMFANVAGLTEVVEKKQPQPQEISNSLHATELKNWSKNVFVTGNGQLFLSNNFQNSNLVWVIPGNAGTLRPFATLNKFLTAMDSDDSKACCPS